MTSTDAIAAKIAYACIYSPDAESAARHLATLVRDRACGLDEGVEEWQLALDELVYSEPQLKSLNRFGARFLTAEWRQILSDVSRQIGPSLD